MAGFTGIQINVEDKQYVNSLDSFSGIQINIEDKQYINSLDSFSVIEISESCTYYLIEPLIVDIINPGVSDISIDTAIRNDIMNTQINGVTDLSIDTVIRNDTMNTQINGVTDLSISPTPYWDPTVQISQNYQK
jgi:hypothetical protein